MIKILKLIAMLLVLLSLSGCIFCFKKPTVDKIQDLKILNLSPDKTELQLSVIVNNPNSYKIRVKRLELELLNQNRSRVGRAALDKEIILPKKKSINLDFKVSLDTRPMVKMVSGINQDVQFFVTGHGEGKAMGINRSFDFEEPYSLNVKEHLQALMPRFSAKGQDLFKVQRTYVDEVGLTKSQLKVDFILLNPYGFTFNFKGFPATLTIDGKEVGTGNLRTQMSFNEDIYYKEGTLILNLSNLKSLFGAVKGAFKGEIAYQVKGKILIDAFGMEISNPYEFSDSIPVNIWDLLLK